MSQTSSEHTHTLQDQVYTYLVDDQEFQVYTSMITVGEIMTKADIPHGTGLLLLLEDGTQRMVAVEEIIDVKTHHHFKKPPRFKRGLQ
jgi:hypothetical protein